jgi:uncharacterized membrane protein YfcA
MVFPALFGAAVLIGWVASMIGVGGGVFMVPLLVIFQFVPATQVAVGTSLAAIVFNSISSTVGYARQRVVDFRLGLMLMPTATVGAWLGAYLTRFISSKGLAVAFGILLVYVAGIMLWGKEPKEVALWLRKRSADGGERFSAWVAALVGLMAGLAAGFFGIGGGAVMVPAMTLLLSTDIVRAVATSLFVMGPSALIGSVQHAFQGNLQWELALPLALGILVGAQLGAFTTTRVPQLFLRRLFGVVLLYSAFNMIGQGL